MSGTPMTRRALLELLAAAPLAARAAAQTPASGQRRVISAGLITYIIEPDTTVKVWSHTQPFGYNVGLGYDSRIEPYTAFEIPGLRNVVNMAACEDSGFALLADGTIRSWDRTPGASLRSRRAPRLR